MKIIYIHHSTFCVEMDRKVLVFDYYSGKGLPSCEYHGRMPEYPGDMPVYVFASHAHRDHFDAEVLKWSKQYSDIHFIFAREVKKKLGNSVMKRLGVSGEAKSAITYVRAGEKYEIGDLVVETLLSTDSGVAFVVTAEGKVIYHAGDLNWWQWEGETEEFNQHQEQVYKRQIGMLADKKPDISFVVVDPRQERDKFLGMDYFLQQVTTGYVIPMHLWKQYDLIKEYQNREGNEQIRERILLFEQENQSLTIDPRSLP